MTMHAWTDAEVWMYGVPPARLVFCRSACLVYFSLNYVAYHF